MKKKIISILVSVAALVAMIAPAQADYTTVNGILYSNFCCDNIYNQVHCIQGNYTPINDVCFCYGQGYGHTC